MKFNLLGAIPYAKREALDFVAENKGDIDFLLDSGAFTAWKSGTPIGVDQYCRFVHALRFEPFGCFTLDVIGDPKGTRDNYDEIRRQGLSPIPIFTRGSSWGELDHWLSLSDYVGVGGGVGTPGFKYFIRDVQRRLPLGKRVHWLGFTDKGFVARWRPYSVDSSMASICMRYNNVMVYHGQGRLSKLKRSDLRDRTAWAMSLLKPFADWCEEDAFALRRDDGWKDPHYSVAARLNQKAWLAYAIDCERRFGTKVFSACFNALALQTTMATLQSWRFCHRKLGLQQRHELSPSG